MTSKEWKECTLEQISTILGDGLHGTPKYSINGKYAFINGNNLSNGKIIIKSDTKRVDKCEYEKYKKDLNNRTLLVSINGTLGNIAEYNEEKIILGKSACYFNVKEDIDKYFIKYILLSKTFQDYLNNQATGTTIKNISLKQMREYNFLLPPLETQQKIAKILSAIDDKIELNNSINNNLEQQAQAIFKSWFVDFEPFGGTMPDDWGVGCLSDIATITMGQSPSGSSYNENKMGTLFFQGRAEFGYRYPKDRLYTTEPKRIAKANDILISVRAPVGDINIALKECCIGRGLAAIEPKNRYNSFVLYSVLNLKKQLNIFNGEGTVFGSINKDSLNGIKTLIPSKEIVKNFEKIVSPMDNLIKYNCIQNEQLTQLRDTLLPKLMNGEIDIEKI